MQSFELNTKLIDVIRKKIPAEGNLAHTLMEILCLGKEAVYRRLRGEVPFTFAEAVMVSRKLGISLDKLVNVRFNESVIFDVDILHRDEPFEVYYSIIEKYLQIFKSSEDASISEMGTSSNVIPQTLYLKNDVLSKFRLFKWMYQNESIRCVHFSELEIPQKVYTIQKEFIDVIQRIKNNIYIWDNMIFSRLVNDIHYFSSIRLISDVEKELIKKELYSLLDELYELTNSGKNEVGNEVQIYISNTNFEATYSYFEANDMNLSMIRIYSVNAIMSQDIEVFKSLKDWIQSLKKFSTLISGSGEMQRIRFFERQREIVNAL